MPTHKILHHSQTYATPPVGQVFYDHAIRQDEDLLKIARYIIANPLRAKLVSEVGAYFLWDAVWVGGMSG